MRARKTRLAVLATSSIFLTSGALAQDSAPSSASARSAQSYAKTYSVGEDEAGQRLTRQRAIGELNAKLEATEGETFGGMYIEHTPAFRVVAKFTANGAATLARYTQDASIIAEGAPVSYKQLVATQTDVFGLLNGLGIKSASQVNVKTSKVEFFVADPAAVQALVSAGTLKLPSYVTIGRAVRALDQFGEAKVEGGRPLSSSACTSGYTIVKAGVRYLTTAGHCGNTQTYNGVSLPFSGENYRANTSFDYQWHTRGSFEQLTNVIYEGLPNLLPITAIWPYENMVVGDYLCKWGAVTGFTCGEIVTKTYNAFGHAGFVKVQDTANSNLSDPGDSGAPWYYDAYNEAWGSHSDSAFDNPNAAIFMPVSYLSNTGHSILTSP